MSHKLNTSPQSAQKKRKCSRVFTNKFLVLCQSIEVKAAPIVYMGTNIDKALYSLSEAKQSEYIPVN